jgi:hypothetical protein
VPLKAKRRRTKDATQAAQIKTIRITSNTIISLLVFDQLVLFGALKISLSKTLEDIGAISYRLQVRRSIMVNLG